MSAPIKRYKVLANFPSLSSPNAFQSVIVEASSWPAAIARASRELKKLPALHRRKIAAMSMTLQLIEVLHGNGHGQNEQADVAHQNDIRFGGTLEETGE